MVRQTQSVSDHFGTLCIKGFDPQKAQFVGSDCWDN